MSGLSEQDVALYQRTIFNMTNQPPDDDQVARIENVRMAAKRLVGIIYLNSPGRSRERSLAITNLEQCLMHAVAAIAREGWDTDG